MGGAIRVKEEGKFARKRTTGGVVSGRTQREKPKDSSASYYSRDPLCGSWGSTVGSTKRVEVKNEWGAGENLHEGRKKLTRVPEGRGKIIALK